jgi:hypothetical protein
MAFGSSPRLATVLVLGSTQTLAWASSYYLPAILGDPIARDLGVPSWWVFGAFSAMSDLSWAISAAFSSGVYGPG